MLPNIFDSLAPSYQETDGKPDKQYSILPTVLNLIGDCSGKVVMDLGCGSGFFTFPLAEKNARRVIGIDSSETQLVLAKKRNGSRTQFILADIFRDELPKADIVNAPFVANYTASKQELFEFFLRIYECLNFDGRAVFVVDFPGSSFSHKRRKEFGAVKWWSGPRYEDECLIQNRLFNALGKLVCVLRAHYYSQATIQFALQEAGFKDIRWHKPIISEDGRTKYGEAFWAGYQDNPELGYITICK